MAGHVPLSAMERLCAALTDQGGDVEVSIALGVDEEGYRVITGAVSAALQMQCQRCLEPVRVPVEATISLAMVWREEEFPSLPARYEGVVVGAEPFDLYELVEDELLLALPLVAAHEPEVCGVRIDPPPEPEPSRRNPFAVLKKDDPGAS